MQQTRNVAHNLFKRTTVFHWSVCPLVFFGAVIGVVTSSNASGKKCSVTTLIIGTFRLDYEYEIEYEYDFPTSNQ